MIHSRAFAIAAIAYLVTLGSAPAGSQEESATPPLRSDHGIQYRSGGIGTDERDALFAAVADYGLKVTFAAKAQSDYVAEVDVTVSDPSGHTVFEARDVGPYLFVRLAPGKYVVAATHAGAAQSKNVTVTAGKQAAVAFYW